MIEEKKKKPEIPIKEIQFSEVHILIPDCCREGRPDCKHRIGKDFKKPKVNKAL